MSKIKIALISVLFGFSSLMTQASETKPEVLGVLFYADWCGSCKVLDPAIEKARGKSDLDNESVLFVTLDLTDATTRHQSELLANSLGLSELYAKNEGATGFMLLIDAETKEVVTRLTKKADANAITAEIKGAIAKVS